MDNQKMCQFEKCAEQQKNSQDLNLNATKTLVFQRSLNREN